MNMAQYVLMVLLSLPASYYDKESFVERERRMEVVARSISDAAARATCTGRFEGRKECNRIWPGSVKDLALMLVTKAWWESRLAQNVHEGNCRKTECDATRVGGVIIHRARTIWQMQKTGLVEPREWGTMVGTDLRSTRTAAWVAARILSRGKRSCHSNFGTFSFYGRSRCAWKGAKVRVLFFRKLKEKTPQQLNLDMERQMRLRDERTASNR